MLMDCRKSFLSIVGGMDGSTRHLHQAFGNIQAVGFIVDNEDFPADKGTRDG
jgi:hypothetical protein